MPKFRILIVDDEEDVRAVLRLALGNEYESVEAHDGLDALDKLEQAEPDFVVLDIMMPLMDGFQTCQAIRKHPKFHDTPVLFLTAKHEKEEIKKGYGAGANLYLTKPFEPDRLVKNVRYLLEERNARPRRKRHTIERLSRPSAKEIPTASAVAEPAEAEEPVRAAPPKPPAAQPAAPTRPRVMLVDDDTELLELLSIALSEEFEVTTAENGIEGVERIVIYQPDLIVLDAMLPKMSGYQLCTSLRRNRSHRRTPIVFISAKSSARDQEYCRGLGANAFLAKPFDPETLRQRLQTYASAPGFTVRPKKMTIAQIRRREKTMKWVEKHEPRSPSRHAT